MRTDDAPEDFPEERVIVREIVRREDSGGIRRMGEALCVALILALGGAVWLLRESVAVLQASHAFLEKTNDKQDTRLDRLEGRSFRGGVPQELDDDTKQ
jgi:hypothetical protein